MRQEIESPPILEKIVECNLQVMGHPELADLVVNERERRAAEVSD